MKPKKVVIVSGDMVTAYGWGVERAWQGLKTRKSAISSIEHFNTETFQSRAGAVIKELDLKGRTRILAMLEPLFKAETVQIPLDTTCLLATTVGEIEILEDDVAQAKPLNDKSVSLNLLESIESLLGLASQGSVVSAACASSNVAVIEAVGKILCGQSDSVLVVACDCMSEFVYAGFSSLLALAPQQARPFDKDREGLTLGEAAGYLLLMSEERAKKEGRTILGEIVGWGLTNDAQHMTGPLRTGEGLCAAIEQSLQVADLSRNEVTSICAHGTGTVANDAMEIQAFQRCFQENVKPVYSIKGAVGHTMGASGLIEILIILESLKEKRVPATVGLNVIDPGAAGWVSDQWRLLERGVTLSTNSGFGGINSALLIQEATP